ncbi:hypothetical protein [Paenibacillus lentus]|uniref:Amidase n=1 Tax=Paenibacillus lentus TaxID=1338368 RepID=A0A3Q8SCN8_9BACL|nr:hypothetical protein [Paenibacillus lentus]AZK47635.1 hypothetical protein EIM92_17005 [Paenibacillus lentus]
MSLPYIPSLRRLFFLLVSSIIIFGPISSPSTIKAKATDKIPKATWLWHTKLIETQTEELLSFSASEGIRFIYLQISTKVDIPHYKNFISKANALGIQVHALNGAADWALRANRSQLTSFIDWIDKYQLAAAEEERFTGIHVDIEPHLLPEWRIDTNNVIKQWQSNVMYLVEESTKLELPIAGDLPFWLDNYTASDSEMSLSSWMISKYDSVTLMSYRNSASAILDLAKQELEEAGNLCKHIYTGVETKYSSEGDHVSFYEEGYDYMNEQLLYLDQLGRNYPSFAGIAIHDLVGMMDLANRNKP